VLLAYSKMVLFEELLASPLAGRCLRRRSARRLLPAALRSRYPDYMPRHPLRREIIGPSSRTR
jgi:glutamate dehydrogenase